MLFRESHDCASRGFRLQSLYHLPGEGQTADFFTMLFLHAVPEKTFAESVSIRTDDYPRIHWTAAPSPDAVRERADEKKGIAVSSLVAYEGNQDETLRWARWDSSYTVKALYRLGFSWPLISPHYLKNNLRYLAEMGFFDLERR